MDYIQSKENLLIKEIKKLKDRKYRGIKNKFVVEGFRFLEEALDSTYEVPNIFLSDAHIERWESFKMEEKLQKGTKVYLVKDTVFKELCSTDAPQGVIATVIYKKPKIKYGIGFYVLADKIQDPGNMGTIIRTAHAAGALGVIATKGTVDLFNEKTLRATMGSIFHIQLIEDFDEVSINSLRESGFKLVVSSLEASKNIFESDLSGKVILCIGNEGNGISSEILQQADLIIKIPMPGGAESLNAGVAASVIIYEALRQRTIVNN